MKKSLSIIDLCYYTSSQLNFFFPDNNKIDLKTEKIIVENALSRLDFCFKHVSLKHYFDGKNTLFNHLYSDHYVMYLWFLSNSVFQKYGKCPLANKIYYLNKILHGLDCMYDTSMPNIFLLFHSSGTMLGKAFYSDFFVALHGCTVGSHRGIYPEFGKGVSLTANSSVIGKSKIGDRVSISTRTTIFNKNVDNDTTAFMDFNSGQLVFKYSANCYSQQFFNIDLNV